ncbi:MAG: acetyl-CoA C-acetyltransferase [Pseudomonadales bacterium]|nr:acetyl-CoA C-acetyltransferase [Pseudomonadales bacterium]
MQSAYIVAAVRTPAGKKNGGLSQWHPNDLGAKVIDELVDRAGVDPELIDDVIFGCVSQIGAQALNIARNSIMASSLPDSVPGVTIDRQCGSSQQAIQFAAQAVMSGTQDLVIAGGVEAMSLVPIGSPSKLGYKNGCGMPFGGDGLKQNYPGVKFSQFAGAELMAKKWQLNREQLDEFALNSHLKAAEATNQGRFKPELVALKGIDSNGEPCFVSKDEGVRGDATLDSIGSLNPLMEGGVLTAATASQISDGAAAVLVANDAGLKKLQANPLVSIKGFSVVGDDPELMLAAPIPATEKVLTNSGLNIDDIDLYEVNEAFAPVPLVWAKALNADPSKLNVNGGAIALGHPLGATGAKLMTTLIYELARQNKKYGLQTMCEGGGLANAMIVERL